MDESSRIDAGEVRRIARLARLTLDDGEVVRLAGDLGRILEYVSHVSELSPAAEAPSGEHGGLRDDAPRPSLAPEDVAGPAPDFTRGHFIVPPVVGP